MKVDRNQDVRPMLVALTAKTRNGELREEYSHSGGIPLRLHIAAHFLAGNFANPDWILTDFQRAATENLRLADALIAAHNETCEVKSE